MNGQIVYLSGPMFSIGDHWEQEQVAKTLEDQGYQTYLPQRDGIEVGELMALLADPNISTQLAQQGLAIVRKCVFGLDMYQLLERCTCAVFNIDGRVPDDGSVVEIAAAYAAGKPIVTFKTSPITFIAGEDNPMIQGLSYTWLYCTSLADLPEALKTIIEMMNKTKFKYRPPQLLSSVIALGRDIAPPTSAFKVILDSIKNAPPATRLAKVKELINWAAASKEYQSAYGGKPTPTKFTGGKIKVVL
jgi:nucleoside 2-deoxyribosyltransferase